MATDNLVKVTEEELRTDRLYYLSHPYTTYGNRKDNINKSLDIEGKLIKEKKIFVMNPLLNLPATISERIAMGKCRILYSACDAIIMCPDWEKSKGCTKEFNWALKGHKPIYLYKEGELYRYGASESS